MAKRPHKGQAFSHKRQPFIVRFFLGLIKKIIVITIMLGLFIGSVFGGLLAINTIFKPEPLENLPMEQRQAEAMKRAQNNVHFLLVGSDERENETSRSDTMIYMVVRPDDKKIAYLSFPRDTLVAIEGYGEDKLNHSYAFGGLELLTATLKNNFHIPIDHTVKVNFKSFQKVIDTMGGITIDVEADMDVPWENIDLKKGKQLLNGYNALAYVRWRSDGRGDLGRIERQQKFMHAVSEKFREMKPWTAAKVLWVIYQEVDTDMSFKDMVLLGTKLIGIGKDDIQHYKLTVQDTYINGISYVLFNEENVKAVIDEMNYGIGVQGEVE